MNAEVMYDSIVDGKGVRATVFISGCKHKCPECHNPETWDFNYGKVFTPEDQSKVIDYCKQSYVNGCTISGGDPLYHAKDLLFFVKRFKAECPDKDIWIYSGFTYEEIMQDKDMKKLVKMCDVLVDGLFEKDNKDLTLNFRGSYNQRIIDIKETLRKKSIVIWEDTYL
jgi:anaerobic ribonucleoside-triphosphate reductase activating protein